MGIATYYIYSLSINLLALLNHVNIGFYFSIRTSPFFYPKGKTKYGSISVPLIFEISGCITFPLSNNSSHLLGF
jgi:hypothetical protein